MASRKGGTKKREDFKRVPEEASTKSDMKECQHPVYAASAVARGLTQQKEGSKVDGSRDKMAHK